MKELWWAASPWLLALSDALPQGQVIFAAHIVGIYEAPVFDAARPPVAPWKPDGFRFELVGQSGQKYDIEASIDLLNWSLVTALANSSGPAAIVDAEAASLPHRFYRAKPATSAPRDQRIAQDLIWARSNSEARPANHACVSRSTAQFVVAEQIFSTIHFR